MCNEKIEGSPLGKYFKGHIWLPKTDQGAYFTVQFTQVQMHTLYVIKGPGLGRNSQNF